MLRIIALLIVALLIGFKLTSHSPAGSNHPQARNPLNDQDPNNIAANYQATHRNAEEVLVKVVQSLKQKPAQTSAAPPAEERQTESKGYSYTAKIQEGKVFLWFCNNPDPRCHIGPFVKKAGDEYSCAIDELNSHLLWKDSGRWFYICNQVQMAPCTVDGTVLEK